jgi:hypothetical protein
MHLVTHPKVDFNPWARFAARVRAELILTAKAEGNIERLRELRRDEAEFQHVMLLVMRPPTRPRRQVVPIRSLRRCEQYTRRNLSSSDGEDTDAR